MVAPTLQWDLGTAYDLFMSLQVLHRPGDYGLRAAWAAGMRSRLPSAEREFLERLLPTNFMYSAPLRWCYELPAPKDSVTALEVLAETPAAQRLPNLLLDDHKDEQPFKEIVQEVSQRGSWSEEDQEKLRELYVKEWKKTVPAKTIQAELDMWAGVADYGERILSALQAYYEVFFAEEERRIQPILEEQLHRAQALAKKLDILDLLEELSQGVRLSEMPEVKELILAPTYWGAPFLYFGEIDEGRRIMLFGARPENASVVPGEIVPDQLLNALKAMSDPTRLRILRYLNTEALTPTQLARRLRLRAPTVIHHLHALRAAGLVSISLGAGKERAYRSRHEGVQATCDMLKDFLEDTDGD
jgi:DNA-binding transcriptional ArsR family regulator